MANELQPGHTVNLYEMPQYKKNMKKVFETKTIYLQGNIPELQSPVELNMVTDDIDAAVEGCKYIFAWIPTLIITTYIPAVATFLPKLMLPNLFGMG